MTDETEWGPWIDHNGSGMPVPKGTVVEVEFFEKCDLLNGDGTSTGKEGRTLISTARWWQSWTYGSVYDRNTWSPSCSGSGAKATPIIRYRVKKPKAMKMIMELLENLPVTKLPEKEDA